jgi:hypothetical protein
MLTACAAAIEISNAITNFSKQIGKMQEQIQTVNRELIVSLMHSNVPYKSLITEK